MQSKQEIKWKNFIGLVSSPLMKKFVLLSLFYIVTLVTNGAEADSNSTFKLITKGSYHMGILLPHRIAMQHIPKELTHGVEINIEKASNNSEDWEKLYNNPTFGLSLLYTSASNYELLGNAFGANLYLLLPIINRPKFKLQTSWGWGVGHIGKKFDRLDNYKNNAIGSNFNLFASIKLKSEIYLNQNLALTAGAAFNHWSNSGFRKPNLGINIPTLNAGFQYHFYDRVSAQQKLSKAEKKSYGYDQKNEFLIMPIVGFTSLSIHDHTVYPAYALNLNYSRLWSKMYKVNFSWDFFYNTGYRHRMNQDVATKGNSALQSGLMVAYEQTIGNFGIILGMGAYVFDQTDQKDPIYHRFGTRFTLMDHIVINTTLHTHWAVSDHMEIGIGYKFKK